MGSSLNFFTFMYLYFLLFSFQLSSSRQPVCHDKEHSALLRFKESLSIDHEYFLACSAKTELWNLEGNDDCCSWDGIKCNEDTGYVTKLDLSSSCLYGSINSNSTLFNLVHLQWLSLADNYFNDSKIPSGILYLSRLSHLNLSDSSFFGQIPPEMLELSNLESLDLSYNWLLQLQQPDLKSLVGKLTNLKVLDLSGVNNISSSQLEVLTNLSSLNFLSLQNCTLEGTIPSSLGNLYNLIHLNLSYNEFWGQIPSEILELSQLEYLDLSGNWDSSLRTGLQLQQSGGLRSLVDKLTNLKWLDLNRVNISSPLPDSLGNLSSLTHLSLQDCQLQGQIPSEMLELSQLEYLDLSSNEDLQPGGLRSPVDKLTNLKWLDLSYVNISSSIPTSLGNLSSLTHLSLENCNLEGQIPSEMLELSHLEYLDLSWNWDLQLGVLRSLVDNKLTNLKWLDLSEVNISSPLPDSLGNLSSLTHLSLQGCQLQGTISSSIGSLTKLVYLDISENNFRGELPISIGNLSSLTYLSLHECQLQGTIPSSIGSLTKLNTLILSSNNLQGTIPSSIGSLTKLLHLDISSNNFRGELPISIGNLSSLTSLFLYNCKLQGTIPSSIGSLTKLVYLDISENNFTGELPISIGNLGSNLQVLDFSGNQLSSQILSSLGNLTRLNSLRLSYNNFSSRNSSSWSCTKLTKLTELSISGANLTGDIPFWLLNLTHLSSLDMSSNQLTGPIPFWLMNLNNLSFLDFRSNQLSGQIPPAIGSLTHLTILDLSSNRLHGPIPSSIFKLKNLEYLNLHSNRLNGTVDLDMYLLKLKSLDVLVLTLNHFSVLTKNTVNTTIHKFRFLGLGSCNLTRFPNFLQNLDELEILDLSSNNITGQIPRWLLNIRKDGLQSLNLSYNLLTGFDHHPIVLPWTNLLTLDLRWNKLQGSLPLPASSTQFYLASNNILTGEIPPQICKLNRLHVLDLSNNNLSGVLPQCLGNFSNYLSILGLQSNNFSGSIPQLFMSESSLRMIDLSHNKLQGKIPRSLANCTSLEFLNLGYNQMTDTFPSWLGILPELKVVILTSNKFHGVLSQPKTNFKFSKLHIIDISHNLFTGKLPSKYFQSWNSMKVVNGSQLSYMEDRLIPSSAIISADFGSYAYAFKMNNKGIQLAYGKISNQLTGISFSGNKFTGEIPTSISNLKALKILNLSNNNFFGCIPSSLGNLTELESLDLNDNKLSGEIPYQLAELNYLQFINVSHNHLKGRIPEGRHFDTFENISFVGNPGLCGKPLSKKCEQPEVLKKGDQDSSESKFAFDRKIVLTGFVSGLVVGVILGNEFFTNVTKWFAMTFGMQLMRVKRRRGHRNCHSPSFT